MRHIRVNRTHGRDNNPTRLQHNNITALVYVYICGANPRRPIGSWLAIRPIFLESTFCVPHDFPPTTSASPASSSPPASLCSPVAAEHLHHDALAPIAALLSGSAHGAHWIRTRDGAEGCASRRPAPSARRRLTRGLDRQSSNSTRGFTTSTSLHPQRERAAHGDPRRKGRCRILLLEPSSRRRCSTAHPPTHPEVVHSWARNALQHRSLRISPPEIFPWESRARCRMS